MKKYTAPELSIVTFNLSDVITSSSTPSFSIYGIEDGGRATLDAFQF